MVSGIGRDFKYVCQGSELTLPEGAGTRRDSAEKESWN
jgi:hypothetical protein